MSADEAKAYGLIDQVLEQAASPRRQAACSGVAPQTRNGAFRRHGAVIDSTIIVR